MLILEKIKESVRNVFRKNKHNDDEFLPFSYGLDLSEKRDATFHGVYFDNVAYQRTQEMIKKSESKRLIKAKHIYSQTKNKRIKKKQLKIITSEELRREV